MFEPYNCTKKKLDGSKTIGSSKASNKLSTEVLVFHVLFTHMIKLDGESRGMNDRAYRISSHGSRNLCQYSDTC